MLTDSTDLTLDCDFASDYNLSLAPDSVARYKRETNVGDDRESILHTPRKVTITGVGIFKLASELDWSDFKMNKIEDLDKLYEKCANCHHSLFDTYPTWYKNKHAYSFMLEDNCCHRCAKPLNIINSFHSLCDKCADDIADNDNNGKEIP